MDDGFLDGLYGQNGDCHHCKKHGQVYAPTIGMPLYCEDCLRRAVRPTLIGCAIIKTIFAILFGVFIALFLCQLR